MPDNSAHRERYIQFARVYFTWIDLKYTSFLLLRLANFVIPHILREGSLLHRKALSRIIIRRTPTRDFLPLHFRISKSRIAERGLDRDARGNSPRDSYRSCRCGGGDGGRSHRNEVSHRGLSRVNLLKKSALRGGNIANTRAHSTRT